MRIPVILISMSSYAIPDWAALAVSPAMDVALHPTFIGYRGRDDGWTNAAWLPLQRHHILFLVDEGYCEMRLGTQSLRFGPGQCFLLHPLSGPQIRFSQKIRFHEVYLKFTERGSAPASHGDRVFDLDQDIYCIEQAWDLGPSIDALAFYHQQDPQSQLLRYSVAQLLLRFDALYREQAQAGHALSSAQANTLIRWTRDHVQHCPEPRDIAQLLDLTPDYCSRVFKQRFGMSLRDWLIRERIQAAARRLREDPQRIEDVASGFGFSNPAHFSRQFKKHMHCTPSAWRRGS